MNITATIRLKIIAYAACALLLYGSLPLLAHAQAAIIGNQTEIEITPIYPEAGTPLTAQFHAYGTTLGTVTWFVDGKRVASGDRLDHVSLTAPALGVPMRIVAQTSIGGELTSIEKTVVPGAVDLIFEGETMSPYFYEGRRVPAIGADVVATAIPHLYFPNGRRATPESLFYTWSINNTILTEGKGQTRVELSIPSLSDDYLNLRIASADGSVSFETGLTIPRAQPKAVFYPWNPLTGLSRNAVAGSFLQASGETTVRVEPYFTSDDVFANAQYGWSLNGVSINNESSDPQFLTLQGGSSGSSADVGFSLQNLKAFAQSVSGLFRIEFK